MVWIYEKQIRQCTWCILHLLPIIHFNLLKPQIFKSYYNSDQKVFCWSMMLIRGEMITVNVDFYCLSGFILRGWIFANIVKESVGSG